VAPPVIIKAFGAASIPLNGATSLTFTIQNNNTTTTLTGVGFSDTLPAGLVVSTPNGLTGSCGGGTITATQATNVISLTYSRRLRGGRRNATSNTQGTSQGGVCFAAGFVLWSALEVFGWGYRGDRGPIV